MEAKRPTLVKCGEPVKISDLSDFLADLRQRGIPYKLHWPDDAPEPVIEVLSLP